MMTSRCQIFLRSSLPSVNVIFTIKRFNHCSTTTTRTRKLQFEIPLYRSDEGVDTNTDFTKDVDGSNLAVPSHNSIRKEDDDLEAMIKDFFKFEPYQKSKSTTQSQKKNETSTAGTAGTAAADDTSKPGSLLPLDNSLNTFPYKTFPKNLITPYELLDKRKKERMEALQINDGPERLSVSNLSPGWCELKKLYDIYASYEKPKTKQMEQGSKLHEQLETQQHPTIDTDKLIKSLQEEADKMGVSWSKLAEEDEFLQTDITTLIKSDPAFPIADQISRLVSLFTTGHAREIRVIGFINRHNFEPIDAYNYKNYSSSMDAPSSLSSSTLPADAVMCSGIIDHLIFQPCSDPNDWSIFEELNLYADDLQEFLVRVPEVLSDTASDDGSCPNIMVSDVKTRGWRSLPRQMNVLRANEFQVLSYRKLLGIMGGQCFQTSKTKDVANDISTIEFCFEILTENFKRRGVDIDAPIQPELILHLLMKNKILIPDAVRLKKGESFDFPLFDNHQHSKATDNTIYDLSSLIGIRDQYNDEYEVLDEELFNGPWVRPMTIRFLLMRLAQIYDILEPVLSDKCSIEYLLRSSGSLEPFKTTYHDYNSHEVNAGLKHSAIFYLTQQEDKVALINPSSFKTYCEPPPKSNKGGCRYRQWCGWYRHNMATKNTTTITASA